MNNSTAGPTTAGSVRISPVQYDEKHLGVTVADADAVFNTTGPHALFSVSERVKAARISQQPASATVLAGGRQVLVEYEDDAAPSGEQSLYQLELYFEDGSQKTVSLYAKKTGVSVAASDLESYAPVIEELQDRAEEHGYETNPDALLDYISWVNERADLVEGWLSQKAAQLAALMLALAMNWLFWLLFLAGVALLAQYIRKKFGGLLDVLENDSGKSYRKRKDLAIQYEEQKQSAAEESLREVKAVGSDDVYWEDAFGARSPKDLADLAARGVHRRTTDGLAQEHAGVSDLDVDSIGTPDCWLNGVLRQNRISSPRHALSELKAACEHMETKWSMGHVYREARDECAQLIRELDKRRETPTVSGGSD
ncbi:hypothetical protein ACFO3H_24900 [Halorussus sp. GCM10023401]|uniref:hypothetical protein n=1 Tax=Halorussus vallis TaxID=2953749 RepID=UPI0020A1F917|nr:hypothetical protein [Halorussus vallis]USZ78644.1 hypothetical protein NGM07_25175 [Halorussus vallis]USZ78675.1 hypothetical protein NGM07_24505 [Halorussus vallis]